MPIEIQRNAQAMYTPEEDVTAELDDGRTIQVALKGVPIPYNQAVKLGLVEEQQPTAEADTGAEPEKDEPGPKENKPQAGPTEKK